jgi:hypothetical protein
VRVITGIVFHVSSYIHVYCFVYLFAINEFLPWKFTTYVLLYLVCT